MKLVEEIRINILVEQFFMYALVYILKHRALCFYKNQEFINYLPKEIINDIMYRNYINWEKMGFLRKHYTLT